MCTRLCNCEKPEERPLTCWSDIYHFCHEHLPQFRSCQDGEKAPRWVFRGDSPWPKQLKEKIPGPLIPKDYCVLGEAFKSRLDRVLEEFEITGCDDKREIEWGLMREFRRKAHLHTGCRGDDWIERLGLMAHYGAPHRMLDWTYSFFIALYFAVNKRHLANEYILWALNKAWLSKHCEELEVAIFRQSKHTLGGVKTSQMRRYRDCKSNRFDTKITHFLMLTNDIPGIYAVTPYYQNERLSTQQGTLLCAGTVNQTWGENLKEVLFEDQSQHPLIKIPLRLDQNSRSEVLRKLHSMNINQATLFPDLTGFAESLRIRLADPETIMQKLPPLDCLEI